MGANSKGYNSYAELISDKSEKIRRTQTMTKVNDLGVGVIYNWNFQMSYSTELWDTGLKIPSEMSSNREVGETRNDNITGQERTAKRYKAHFKYVGLSVQLPTKARMDAHLKGSKDGKVLQDVFHTVLIEATKNTFANGSYDAYRKLNRPIEAAQIFNVCSFFDLGALESYYIQEGAKGSPLTQLSKFSDNFPGAIEQGSTMDIAGVNTAAGDQGGPLRQAVMAKRGPTEWIVSAYFALYENESDVLAARRAQNPDFAAEVVKIRTAKTGVDKKIYDLFQWVAGFEKMRSPAMGNFLQSIPFDVIQKTVKAFGLGPLSESDLISGEMTTDRYVTNKQMKSLLAYVSFDSGKFSLKNIMSSDGVSSDKRAMVIENVIMKPIISGVSSNTLKIDLDKVFRDLGKEFQAKFGYALQDSVLKEKKYIEQELIKISQAQADIQSLKRMASDLKKRAKEFHEKAKSSFGRDLDVQSIDINIFVANRDEINKRVNSAKQVITKALNKINDILVNILEKPLKNNKA